MKKIKIRLAMRHEGQWWNAYIAQADTMEGAYIIGSILIGAVRNQPGRKQAFLNLMQDVLADAAESVTGERPTDFEVEPAPEAERSGHG